MNVHALFSSFVNTLFILINNKLKTLFNDRRVRSPLNSLSAQQHRTTMTRAVPPGPYPLPIVIDLSILENARECQRMRNILTARGILWHGENEGDGGSKPPKA